MKHLGVQTIGLFPNTTPNINATFYSSVVIDALGYAFFTAGATNNQLYRLTLVDGTLTEISSDPGSTIRGYTASMGILKWDAVNSKLYYVYAKSNGTAANGSTMYVLSTTDGVSWSTDYTKTTMPYCHPLDIYIESSAHGYLCLFWWEEYGNTLNIDALDAIGDTPYHWHLATGDTFCTGSINNVITTAQPYVFLVYSAATGSTTLFRIFHLIDMVIDNTDYIEMESNIVPNFQTCHLCYDSTTNNMILLDATNSKCWIRKSGSIWESNPDTILRWQLMYVNSGCFTGLMVNSTYCPQYLVSLNDANNILTLYKVPTMLNSQPYALATGELDISFITTGCMSTFTVPEAFATIADDTYGYLKRIIPAYITTNVQYRIEIGTASPRILYLLDIDKVYEERRGNGIIFTNDAETIIFQGRQRSSAEGQNEFREYKYIEVSENDLLYSITDDIPDADGETTAIYDAINLLTRNNSLFLYSTETGGTDVDFHILENQLIDVFREMQFILDKRIYWTPVGLLIFRDGTDSASLTLTDGIDGVVETRILEYLDGRQITTAIARGAFINGAFLEAIASATTGDSNEKIIDHFPSVTDQTTLNAIVANMLSTLNTEIIRFPFTYNGNLSESDIIYKYAVVTSAKYGLSSENLIIESIKYDSKTGITTLMLVTSLYLSRSIRKPSVESVLNGTSVPYTNNPVNSFDPANKDYVDSHVGGEIIWFFSNTASDLAGYKKAETLDAGISTTTTTITSTTTGTAIEEWATIVGVPGISILEPGVIPIHLYAKVAVGHAGSTYKHCQLFIELYQRVTAGTETKLGTSTLTDYLTETTLDYDVDIHILSEVVLTADKSDRFIFKVLGVVSGSAPRTNNPNCVLSYGGTTDTYAGMHVTAQFLINNYARLNSANTFTGDQTLGTDKALNFRDSNSQIKSTASKTLEILIAGNAKFIAYETYNLLNQNTYLVGNFYLRGNLVAQDSGGSNNPLNIVCTQVELNNKAILELLELKFNGGTYLSETSDGAVYFTNGARGAYATVGVGTPTADEHAATKAYIDKHCMIGAANSAKVPCAFIANIGTSQTVYSDGSGESFANASGGNIYCAWRLNLPTNRGGLKLYAKGLYIDLYQADANNKITLIGADKNDYNTDDALFANDTTGWTSQQLIAKTFTAVDLSSYSNLTVYIKATTNAADSLRIRGVCFDVYYA